MQLTKISFLALSVLLIATCSPSKKSTHTTASAPPVQPAAPATAPIGPELPPKMARSNSGIFAPGSEQLTAIQEKYKEVTLQTLTDGYALYTGVCTNCHGAKSIYRRPTEEWAGIINDMAQRANITDVQKDAVYKYVLSIKATQPKAN